MNGELSAEVMVLALSIGLVLSLVCYLVTNLSPGGMITPAWVAVLLVTDATRAAIVAVVVAVTYLVIRVLQRVVILYGKRLFATVVLVAVFLQVTVSLVLVDRYPTLIATTTLGFIVPGLIVYQLIRQPVVPTLVTMGAVAGLTYTILLSGVLLRFIPAS